MTWERLARIGYAGRGVVFLILGYFCAVAAIGSTRPVASSDAFRAILHKPFGSVLLLSIAAGLFCFAGWRLAQALLDADDCGRNMRGCFRRIAYGVAGVFYFVFAALALSVLAGLNTGNSDSVARDWTATLLGFPFGTWVVGAIGVALIATGIGTCVAGIRAEFADRISLSPQPRRLVVALGVLGYLTRAVVFTLIGLFFIFAAMYANANEATGVAGTLRTIQYQRYGTFLLGVTAAGLLAFGGFGIAEALFRRIPAEQGLRWRLRWHGT